MLQLTFKPECPSEWLTNHLVNSGVWKMLIMWHLRSKCCQNIACWKYYLSRLSSSKPQGQEETACTRPADMTTGVLFTATNTVKFPCTVTWSSWALPISYYKANTFLPCGISKSKMNKLSATIVKNQPFRLLWRLFPYLSWNLIVSKAIQLLLENWYLCFM